MRLSSSSILVMSSMIMHRKSIIFFFFFNDTATTEIYTLSLHDALPICPGRHGRDDAARCQQPQALVQRPVLGAVCSRSEEHTSELQSRLHLVCRLLLEKKKRPGTYVLRALRRRAATAAPDRQRRVGCTA